MRCEWAVPAECHVLSSPAWCLRRHSPGPWQWNGAARPRGAHRGLSGSRISATLAAFACRCQPKHEEACQIECPATAPTEAGGCDGGAATPLSCVGRAQLLRSTLSSQALLHSRVGIVHQHLHADGTIGLGATWLGARVAHHADRAVSSAAHITGSGLGSVGIIQGSRVLHVPPAAHKAGPHTAQRECGMDPVLIPSTWLPVAW